MESLILYLSYATMNSISSYKLIRKNEFNLKKDINNINYDMKKCCSKKVKYDPILKDYIEILETEIRSWNLFNLYNNLENLEVKSDKKILLLSNLANYNPSKNLIKYANKKSIGHELLHVASTNFINEENVQVGFSVKFNKNKLGNAINEGYTDHLNDSLFNNHARAYNCIRIIAKETEDLLGKDKMRDLYFNNNLLGLIKELEKYLKTEEVLKFISMQDGLLSTKCANNIAYKFYEYKINKLLEIANENKIKSKKSKKH